MGERGDQAVGVDAALVPVRGGELLGFALPAANVLGALGFKHAVRVHFAGFDAGVLQVGHTHGEVAARADGAALVGERGAAQVERAACGEKRRSGAVGADGEAVEFFYCPHAIALAGAIAGAVVAAARQLGNARAVFALGGFQYVADVADGGGVNAQVAGAFEGAGAVFHQGGGIAGVVGGDVEVAEAVHIGQPIDKAPGTQRHIRAAEDQPAVVKQAVGFDAQGGGRAKGAVVVEGVGACEQALGGGDVAAVDEGAADAEIGVATGLPSCVCAGVDAGGGYGQVALAEQCAVAAVGAGEGQAEGAVGFDAAVVLPGVAGGGDALFGEQFAGGGMAEVADVEADAVGLQLAGVGPVGGCKKDSFINRLLFRAI